MPEIAVAANPEIDPAIPRTGMGIIADRSLFSSGNHPYRAMSAITLAHLAHLANFEILVDRYNAELATLHNQDRDKFDQLVKYLKELGGTG